MIEMATGKPPWSQYDPVTAMFQIALEDTPIPDLPEDFSKEAKEFVKGCMQRNMKDRLSTNDLLKHSFLTVEQRVS